MLEKREQQYLQVLQDIQQLINEFSHISDIPKKSYELIAKHPYLFNLHQIEKESAYPFSSWVLNKFQNNAPELIKILFFLVSIKHPIQPNIAGIEPFIHQIIQKPNALLILKLLFSNIEAKFYQTENFDPPYANQLISDEVFEFLIDNYYKYSSSLHPIFWCLKNQKFELLEKILTIKPKWIDFQSDIGFTPLMLAIKYKFKAGLLTLLKFNPNPYLLNKKNESIAHILCRTQDPVWIEKLTSESEFTPLDISSMMERLDQDELIPLSLALSEQTTPWIQQQLLVHPHLRPHLYKCYTNAILQNQISQIELLYHALELKFFDCPDRLIELLIKANETHRDEILNWLLDLEDLPLQTRRAVSFLNEIEKRNIEKNKKFLKETKIDWEQVPAQVCFTITRMLILRSQISKITELQLFHLHPNFHTYICPNTKTKTTFLDVLLKTHGIQVNSIFIDYFLNYLEENAALYPRWIAHFHDDFVQLLHKWEIPKNKLVHGSSLLHFIAAEEPHNITRFINADVHVNQLDKYEQHLFSNLLKNHEKGFELIKELYKNHALFSLQNLDFRGSNLLHLSIEMHDIPCLNWCITQNLSILDERFYDEKNALELAYELQPEDIFITLKKHLRKNQMIPFLNKLIREDNDRMLEHLFANAQPFDWQFSAQQIQELRELKHPIIQVHLDEFHNKKATTVSKSASTAKEISQTKIPVINKPKLIPVNHESLIEWINKKNDKTFEKLIQPEYQPFLENLFQTQFIVYLEMVFQSSCTNLNKIFLRIPAAIPKFEEHQAWLHLLTVAVTNDDKLLFDNLMGRKTIRDYLKSKFIECFKITILQNKESWFDLLNAHFALTPVEKEQVFHDYVHSGFINQLNWFLKDPLFKEVLLSQTDLHLINKIIFTEPSNVEVLFQHPALAMYIFKNAHIIFLEGFLKKQELSLIKLLENQIFRERLSDHPSDIINQAAEINEMDKLAALWKKYFELSLHLKPYIPALHLVLHPYIIDCFRLSTSASQSLFIFGGAVHFLIEGMSLEYLNDIDFIAPEPPTGQYVQSKVQPQLFFTTNKYFTNNFYKPYEDIKLEYFVNRHNPKHFIAEDFRQRDFTVNCLYCDRDGRVFDPSSFGLSDLRNRLIRTVKNPEITFEEDPIRILRAIRLIMKGFYLLPEVHQAITNWVAKIERHKAGSSTDSAPPNMNYGHIYAMANQMLNSPNGYQIMTILIEFKLLNTLLEYTGTIGHDELLQFVNSEATRYKEIKLSTHRK